VGAADGYLYCLDVDGGRVWEYSTGNRIDAAPAAGDINKDGVSEIVVASLDGSVTCLTRNGVRLWSLSLDEPVFATPVITDECEVVIATLCGTLACVKPDGEPRWRQTLMAVESERTLYHGVPSGKQYALAEGGAAAIYSSPVVCDVVGDGCVLAIFGVVSGKVLAYDLHGALRWEATAGGRIYSSPVVMGRGTADALIVIGSDDGRLHALDNSGRLVWQFDAGGAVRSSPVVVPAWVAGSECVVVGSSDHHVYIVDREGQEIDDYLTGGEIGTSPAVADVNRDGLAEIVVGSYDHRVYAFRTDWHVPVGEIVAGLFRGGAARTGT
jgi:hypothetical protein